MGHANNTLYRHSKCHYNMHAQCTLKYFLHISFQKNILQEKGERSTDPAYCYI